MRQKYSAGTLIHKAGFQSADDPFEFVMSTERKDRDGDIIRQEGWQLGEFRRNPIALWMHNHNVPIGTWEKVSVEGGQLIGRLKMAAAGTSRFVDEVRSLLEQKVLRAVSVGFLPVDYAPLDENRPWDGYDLKKNKLLECSVVSVPANPEALSVAKSIGISKETRDLVLRPVSGAKTNRMVAVKDYSDLLGEPSHVLRNRRALAERGLIETSKSKE